MTHGNSIIYDDRVTLRSIDDGLFCTIYIWFSNRCDVICSLKEITLKQLLLFKKYSEYGV